MQINLFLSFLSVSEGESCSVVSDSLRLRGLYSPWNSLGQNTGVDSLSLLQGIFPIQGLNPGLPHCRQILYQLSHQGRPEHIQMHTKYTFRHMHFISVFVFLPKMCLLFQTLPVCKFHCTLGCSECHLLNQVTTS